jgi:hypothetical protein
MPQIAALSPDASRMQGSTPRAAPARGLKASASAAPFAKGFALASSFQVQASHTATRLSSPTNMRAPFKLSIERADNTIVYYCTSCFRFPLPAFQIAMPCPALPGPVDQANACLLMWSNVSAELLPFQSPIATLHAYVMQNMPIMVMQTP